MVSHWSLSDRKSPQVSRTLSILSDLNNVVVWMVSTHPLISKSSSPFTNPLVSVLRAPITIDITVSFMFHSFSSSLARSWYLSVFLLSFSFTLWSARMAKSTIQQVLFFLLTITRSGRLAKIRWSICISRSQRILYVSFTGILFLSLPLLYYYYSIFSFFGFLESFTESLPKT